MTIKADLPGTVRVLAILMALRFLSGCAEPTDRDPEIYLIPEGYVGQFYIIYNVPQGEPQRYEGNARVYEIPSHGMLLMQSGTNAGWIESDQIRFFYTSERGDRTEITERWSTTLHDTPENREDKKVTAFGVGIGTFEALKGCELVFTYSYIGTKSQALDQVGAFDIFDKKGVKSIDVNILREACGAP